MYTLNKKCPPGIRVEEQLKGGGSLKHSLGICPSTEARTAMY